jgi:tRNA pseudouridine38-40 synthase
VKLFNSFNKIVLVVEYDGRNYYGFQWQANLPTIQAELERAIQRLTGEGSRVIAASRTDAGVHARGQVVSFRTKSVLPPQTFVRALNHYLPGEIAIKGACKVNMDFNVRRDAVSREYDYRILNSSTRSPLFEGFACFVPKKLNIEAMNKTCKFIEGKHDFASFAAALGKLRSTRRTVYEAKVTEQDELVIYHMTADSFLPHQVRNTVGLLIRIGLGKVGIEEFQKIMEEKRLGLAGPTAPAHGLCLTKVNYPDNLELAI